MKSDSPSKTGSPVRTKKNFIFPNGGMRRKQKRFFILLCFTLFFLLLHISINDQWKWLNFNYLFRSRSRSEHKIYRNYFLDVQDLERESHVVNTSECKIPDFSNWKQKEKKAKPIEDCKKKHYNWTFVQGNDLVINKYQMEKDGDSFVAGSSCCYKVISRVTQSLKKYDTNADNQITYSTCIPIVKERTEILDEFIMVTCGGIFSWFKQVGVKYRNFHAMALPKRGGRSKGIFKKINYWRNRAESESEDSEENDLPPNILLIGLDSTSRLNFKRNMPTTRKLLESIGAVEMFGYTKVGENTFPNMCAVYDGYSEDDLTKICYFDRWKKQDDCPSIWKRLHAANYLTAHTEDAPEYAIFNYMKTAFVKQPVDFYSRPLFFAAHDYGNSPFHMKRAGTINCLGPKTNDEMLTSYLESKLDTADENMTPIFAMSWSTTLSHGSGEMIQLLDETYTQLLKRLISKGQLENTILFFMGDHGYRFGSYRETLIGYFEDKLPNMWIRLPDRIKEKYPQWQHALEINSRRLTSPFTLHWTLNLILDTFTSVNATGDSVDAKTGSLIPRKHRQNFFQPVPKSNTCSDVGVPENYCACYPLQTIALDDPFMLQAAQVATNKLNGDYGDHVDKCAKLQVSKITAGALMDKTSTQDTKRYIVGFVTIPGEYLFEAEVDFYVTNATFNQNPSVQRANKVNQDFIQCARDPKLELICYCID